MLAVDVEPSALAGVEVVDRRGERLGKVRQVYPDGEGIGWVAVRGNLFGTSEALVPLDGAVLEDDVLAVPVSRSRFLSAPRRPADQALDESEREAMHAFYESPEPLVTPVETTPVAAVAAAEAVVPDGGEVTMTAYRERMRVSTERVPTARVRLTKTVVTEQQTLTVTVRREEVRLVREPIEPGDAVPGAAVGAAEQEVVLHEERVVVGTEVIPVERVRLVVDEVAEDREVTAAVRRERIELTEEPGAS